METFERVLIALVVLLSVGVMGSCTAVQTHNRNAAAVAMQKAGANPLDIPCALEGMGTERYCELRAATMAAQKVAP